VRNSDNLLRPGTRPCLTTMYQVLAALLIGLTPLAVTAATIVVTSPDDTSPVAATTCTLRQAILSMNAASLKGNCGNTGAAFGTGDLITFAAAAVTGGTNSHSVTLTDSADATGAVGGTLVVTAANVTIDASSWPTFASPFRGSLGIGKDGNANDGRAIRGTGSSTLTLNSLLLVGGKATPDCGGSARGGAVCMPGPNSTLNLLNSTLYGNSAVDGGGVFVDGTLNVNGSAVLNNSSSGSGAGIFVIGTANVTDTYLSSNLATTNGGGILCAGSLTLTGSTLVQNTAIHGGGVAGSDNSGCALIVKNSTLFFNSANTQGGGIYNSGPVTLTHATVVYNSAPTGAEIYEAFFAEAVKLGNSIVAGPGASEIVGGTLSSTFSITSLAGLNLGRRVVLGGSARASRSTARDVNRSGAFARLGFGRWGLLSEHERVIESDTTAEHEDYVGTTVLFTAPFEWLVASVASQYSVDLASRTRDVHRLSPSVQIRVSDNITFAITEREMFGPTSADRGRSLAPSRVLGRPGRGRCGLRRTPRAALAVLGRH